MGRALRASWDELVTVAVSAAGMFASAWSHSWFGATLFGTLFLLTLVACAHNIFWRVHE